MTARKYEFLTDGSEALIAQFVKEPSEEAALKVFNEVSRHNTLSSNELKNIAIDEIRKEIHTLATKDELKLSHDSIHDRLSSMEEQIKTLATKDELKATEKSLRAEIKASSANMIRWVVSVQIATIASIIVILKFFLNY